MGALNERNRKKRAGDHGRQRPGGKHGGGGGTRAGWVPGADERGWRPRGSETAVKAEGVGQGLHEH